MRRCHCCVFIGTHTETDRQTDRQVIIAVILYAGTETRCYCNEAACVSTGYMCKSTTLGVCFSRLTSDGASVRSTHGCAESLPEVEYGACSRLMSTSSGVAGEMSLLLCCHQDMCNYRSDVGYAVSPLGECL